MNEDKKIDIVYTWVDGNDEQWQKEKSYWAQKEGVEVNICRYIDNHELRYSLRSVFKNLEWINKIYIVTNGQIPEWLDTSHPKIEIITHKDIMPEGALPTFNASAIETCIQNIPNLSEYFIYANDDFFVYKKLSPDYFFSEDGKPIIRLVKQNWSKKKIEKNSYCAMIVDSMNYIEKIYGKKYKYESSHNMMPYRKSCYCACKNLFDKEFTMTCYKKFRDSVSVQRSIVSFYTLANDMGILKKIKIRSHIFKLDNAYIKLSDKEYIMKKLKVNNPNLFCINDNEGVVDKNRIQLEITLKKIYPIRAPWEKSNTNESLKIINTNTTPKVSVIVPVYNVEKYLRRCLDSIINQTMTDIEIICVNDGSTDESLAILQEYEQTDNRIRIISQKNQGLSAARNTGIDAARGEYISFIDSDDWVDLDFIEKLYTAATKNDADIAACGIVRCRKHYKLPIIIYSEQNVTANYNKKLELSDVPTHCYVWNKLYKKEALSKSNIRFEEGRIYEDVLFTPIILYYSKAFVTVPDTNYYYFRHKNTIVKKHNKKSKQDYAYATAKLKEFFKDKQVNVSAWETKVKKLRFIGLTIFKTITKRNIKKHVLFNLIRWENEGINNDN